VEGIFIAGSEGAVRPSSGDAFFRFFYSALDTPNLLSVCKLFVIYK